MAGPDRHASYAQGDAFSSGGTDKFIPALWAGKMVDNLYKSTCFGEIANTDYEGEIKDVGDSVIINTTPEITIKDYEIGNPAGITYEEPTNPNVLLDINKAKYFGFKCNDIEEYQSKPNLIDTFSKDAGKRMAVAIDADVLSTAYLGVHARNTGNYAGLISGNGVDAGIDLGSNATPLTLTSANIVEFLVNVGLVLDEQDAPQNDRWIVLPHALIARIKTSELKDASLAGDSTSILRNGKVGMIDRLTLYGSNNLTIANGEYQIIAGHASGLTFASQMAKMEDLMNPNDFGKLVRGLNVFGHSVIKPEVLVHAQVAV